jgi:hypothetical protein
MDGKLRKNEESGPNEETRDAPAGSTPGGECPRVQLVEGSSLEMSCETRSLLRSRLRAASLIMCGGFVVFFFWNLLNVDFSRPEHIGMIAAHVAITALLGVCGVSLCRKCNISTLTLRLKELVVFGLPGIYFAYLQYLSVTENAREYQVLPMPQGAWMILIFTYATFIPNTWKRAAVVIGVFAAAPLALSVGLHFWDVPSAAARNAGLAYFSYLALIMLVTAVFATVGVHIINNLRREVFVARQLGQYRLRHLLGSGGMGEVYMAEHQLMKRPVAIKIIRPGKAGDPKVLARFEREVRATAKLSHWNTIDIFDYGRAEDGTFYYVMEYLPGLNLHELVQRHGPMPAERAVHLVRQTCDALEEAHRAGLIHRDIKPANIFAAERGGVYDVAKLLDFGLAKPLAKLEGANLTQEGTITGSPLYMSPEQATGDREPDARSDVYSLGGVLYYMLTGRPPFDDESPLKVMVAHASRPPAFPPELRGQIPSDLEDVVLRCLAKQPEDRYQSAADLAAALDDCDLSTRWTREHAAQWWREFSRPRAAQAEPQLAEV